MSSAIPYTFLGSFLATVFALQWWMQPAYPLWMFGILGCFGIVGIFLRPRMAALMAMSLGISLAFLSVSRSADRGIFPNLDRYIGQKKIVVEGTVAGQPDDRGTQLQTVFAMSGARILLIDKYTGVIPNPGDRLRVTGTMRTAEAGSSYEQYLRMRDIGATLDVRQMDVVRDFGVGAWRAMPLQRTLWQMKKGFQNHLHRILPEPAGGLLDGLLTGNNGGLSQTIQADFRTTGLSHIVAVSGSNITVVLSVLGSLLF